MRIAYILGLTVSPFAMLGAMAYINSTGPQTCERRDDITFSGHRVAVEYCTGSLGLATTEPQVVAYLD